MGRTRYVALLRGINVGGRNKVPMAELRTAVEDAGHTDVTTYIQSGNVLFVSSRSRADVEAELESVLERRFGFPLVVVVRSHAQLRAIVDQAPSGFGKKPDAYHSDVVFLRSPLTPAKAMKVVELREEVDQAWPGRGVVYFARLSTADAEPDVEDRRDTGIRADDDSQLVDDDEVARAPGRRFDLTEHRQGDSGHDMSAV